MIPYAQETPAGLKIRVRLSPKAKREGIEGIYTDADGNEALKIAVNAPPVDGKANKSLIALLARLWRLPKTSFEIISGQTDRNKMLLISGHPQDLPELIRKEVKND